MNIDTLLVQAREMGCSDLHVTIGLPVMGRLGGNLLPLNDIVLNKNDCYELLLPLLSKENLEKLKNNIDADFSYTASNHTRHRINMYKQRGALSSAIRLLRNDIPSFEDLGLPPSLSEMAMLPRGLILITGPTGSGKSTTLAAMIDSINQTKNHHIITIEDPIEYVHQHKKSMINQREVGDDVSAFATALRSALREDPDVILVGEMRDLETISAAITAAETGHLVLSTLHTTGAAKTIDRIIGVFPESGQQQIRTQLAGVLKGVVSQTLVPKIDSNDRIAVQEILKITDAVANLIRENKCYQIDSVIQTNFSSGMQLLDAELAKLVKNNIISKQIAEEKCVTKSMFNTYLTRSIT